MILDILTILVGAFALHHLYTYRIHVKYLNLKYAAWLILIGDSCYDLYPLLTK